MDLFERCRAAARAHPLTLDAALAAAAYALPLASSAIHRNGGSHLPERSAVLWGLAVCLPLVLRRALPMPVLAVSALAACGYIADGHPRGPMLFGPMVAAYTVCVSYERARALAWGTAATLAVGTVSLACSPEPWNSEANGVAYAWIGLAVAVGEATRSRRAFVAAIEERARRAEYTREEEARRRVVEERLRIARELHDIVGHHIALINVQAGVASHFLETRPELAREALAHVREAGRGALAELGATVSVLRRPDEPADAPPSEPAPGLGRLDALLESFERAGIGVLREVVGRTRALPSAVDLAAYRIVQESLTNVRKHAGTSGARVRLDFGERALRVEVCDDGPGASAAPGRPARAGAGSGSGFGVIGMRERAAAVGGAFAAGPRAGGGFLVSAELPYGDALPRPDGLPCPAAVPGPGGHGGPPGAGGPGGPGFPEDASPAAAPVPD